MPQALVVHHSDENVGVEFSAARGSESGPKKKMMPDNDRDSTENEEGGMKAAAPENARVEWFAPVVVIAGLGQLLAKV